MIHLWTQKVIAKVMIACTALVVEKFRMEQWLHVMHQNALTSGFTFTAAGQILKKIC